MTQRCATRLEPRCSRTSFSVAPTPSSYTLQAIIHGIPRHQSSSLAVCRYRRMLKVAIRNLAREACFARVTLLSRRIVRIDSSVFLETLALLERRVFRTSQSAWPMILSPLKDEDHLDTLDIRNLSKSSTWNNLIEHLTQWALLPVSFIGASEEFTVREES